MKKQLLKVPFFAIILFRILISSNSYSQTIEQYVTYQHTNDLLFDNDQEVLSIANYPLDCWIGKDQPDFFTGHSVKLRQTLTVMDQGITISEIYRDSGQNCEPISQISSFIINMRKPDEVIDPDKFPIINNEILYDLKVNSDGTFLIGIGEYHINAPCNDSSFGDIPPSSFEKDTLDLLDTNSTKDDDFIMFPNPAENNIVLNKIGNYLIFNFNGKIVLEVKEAGTINISELVPGIYFIRNEEGITKKFIKN